MTKTLNISNNSNNNLVKLNKKFKYSYKDYLNHKNIDKDENSLDNKFDGENEMDKIVDGIWLGNYRSAYNKNELDNNNIKYIINISDKIECPFNDIKYLYIPIRDKYSCHPKTSYYIVRNYLKAFEFINNALDKKQNVLIHCVRGHSRSASIVLFYLIYKYKLSYVEALLYIKHIRPKALNRPLCMNKWGMRLYAYMCVNGWLKEE